MPQGEGWWHVVSMAECLLVVTLLVCVYTVMSSKSFDADHYNWTALSLAQALRRKEKWYSVSCVVGSMWWCYLSLHRPVACDCCVLCREWWALHKALCTTSAGERQLVSNWSADTLTWWVT